MNLTDTVSLTRAPSSERENYYGLPVVKRSPWDWKVAGYLFAGALAGVAQLLAGIACRFGGARMQYAVRNARYLALAGAGAGAGLLLRDLKTPQRFYNMLRIFRRTSPMSIGSYVLASFGALSALTALREWRHPARGAALASQLPAALVAVGQCTYTAPLLASSSTPLWAVEPELLAARYGTSAIALAAAALSLIEQAGGRSAAAKSLDALAVTASAAQWLVVHEETARLQRREIDPASGAPEARVRRRAANALTTAVPLACAVIGVLTRSRAVSMIGSAAIVIGTALSRYCDIADGNRSAQDPDVYLRFTQAAGGPHTSNATHE